MLILVRVFARYNIDPLWSHSVVIQSGTVYGLVYSLCYTYGPQTRSVAGKLLLTNKKIIYSKKTNDLPDSGINKTKNRKHSWYSFLLKIAIYPNCSVIL